MFCHHKELALNWREVLLHALLRKKSSLDSRTFDAVWRKQSTSVRKRGLANWLGYQRCYCDHRTGRSM